jgi:predicted ArsR family transcriptional regulator
MTKKKREELKQRIQWELARRIGIDQLDIAGAVGIHLRTCCRLLDELQREGKIKPVTKD